MAKDAQIVTIAGKRLRISSLDKAMFPDDGITKAEILDYYLEFAPVLIPHIRRRPLTLLAWPHGIVDHPYYRKWLTDSAPKWLHRTTIEGQETPIVEDEADLMWVINQDSIELHTRLSRADDLERPDLLLFDLDPGPEAGFVKVCRAAIIVRDALKQLGVRSWAKVSGSKGIHLMSPLDMTHDFDQVHEWSEAFAKVLAGQYPDVFTVSYNKDLRGNKVLLDHNQIRKSRNTASIYSIRPLPGAPISAPVAWEEVESAEIEATSFKLTDIRGRIEEHGDLAGELLENSYALPHIGG